jgi:hypothetical protein
MTQAQLEVLKAVLQSTVDNKLTVDGALSVLCASISAVCAENATRQVFFTRLQSSLEKLELIGMSVHSGALDLNLSEVGS